MDKKYGVLDKKAAAVLAAVAGVFNALVVLGFMTVEEASGYTTLVSTLLVLGATVGVGKVIEGYVYSRKTVEESGALSGEYIELRYCEGKDSDSCECGCAHGSGPMGTVSHDKRSV